MMRRTGMMLGICALAACSRAEQPPARQTADAAPDSALAPSAPAAAAPRDSGAATVRIHPTLPPHAFALHEGEPGVVDSIVVSVDGRRVQTLRPRENHVLPDAGAERLSTIDLDFDGYADLALLSVLAMANSTSEYWRFDPAARRFVPAGEFETLTPDSAARELTHYNRGGHGGRLWTAARWRWADTALVLVSEEEQDALGDGERYVHIVRQPRGGRMVEVRRDTLQGEALRSSPSWAEP
ncbi:MAG TPA: hypothetical protein VEQ60_06605 [Longimicrobium sp.]|nr:hypothetical protein [Longimicrobium sp.]